MPDVAMEEDRRPAQRAGPRRDWIAAFGAAADAGAQVIATMAADGLRRRPHFRCGVEAEVFDNVAEHEEDRDADDQGHGEQKQEDQIGQLPGEIDATSDICAVGAVTPDGGKDG